MLSLNALSKFASILQPRKQALAVSAIESGSVFADEMLAGQREKTERHFASKTESKFYANKKQISTDAAELISEKETDRSFYSIGVLGAKGGTGSSTVALNLSLALSKNGLRSTIVDANLQQPDIAVMLGRQPDHSISEFVTRRGEMDEQLWNACRMPIMQEDRQSAVCSLLSGPASGEAARQTSLSQIAQCFLGIQMYSDVLLVDLPKNLDKHLVTALDSLDFIVLVFDATLASIAAARRWKNIFAELSYPADKIIYVENRSGARSQLGGGSVLALEPAAKLPNAYAFLEECCNSAEPAMLKNPRQAFSKAIANFAEQIDRLAKTRSMSGRTEA